jgi:putative ABC transport system permease protein
VADVRQSDVRQEGHPEIYLPFSARPWRRTHLVVRGTTDGEALAAAVGQVVREVDAGVSMEGPRTMTTIVEGTIADARLLTTLLTLFGLTGLALGAVGVHGVTAQSVAERRREIGIRLALGAERTEVTRSTVVSGLRPVVVGLGAGVIVALLVGRTLDTVLFDVRASDPGSIAVASLVLVLVALAALLLPALRAGRTDPVRSLRQE